jgi:transposase
MPRKRVVVEYLNDPEAWKRKHDYGQRWIAETVFSSYKRAFGEYVSAKKMENMTRELMIKANLYNTFIALTTNL